MSQMETTVQNRTRVRSLLRTLTQRDEPGVTPPVSIVEVCFSLVLLIFLAPVFLVVALLVRLTSPGPVFYRQERVGLDGRSFRILKFRSLFKHILYGI